MKVQYWLTPLLLLPIACGGAPPPEPVEPEPQFVAPPEPPEPPPAPELTEEEKAQQAAAAKLAEEFAKLDKEIAEEASRWTDELRAEATQLASATYPSAAVGIPTIMKGNHRVPGNAARDVYRHPKETLDFFGLKPSSVVLELGPGAGWYTELLAPFLASKGKLIVTVGDPTRPRTERGTLYAQRTDEFLKKSPELFGKVESIVVDGKAPSLPQEGTVDFVLSFRGMHSWHRDGVMSAWLTQIHKVLKKGGVLGVEQHRAKADADPNESAKKGYLPEAFVISQVEAAGFKLSKKSEINANPKDTTDHPDGVWSLPPTLRSTEPTEREKFEAIGESDRMTLRFVKQ